MQQRAASAVELDFRRVDKVVARLGSNIVSMPISQQLYIVLCINAKADYR